MSPDPVFGKSSFHVAYHQDWVSGSFVVQVFEAVYVRLFCTLPGVD
ncbi:MAG TPA: hypothetical protein VN414_03650 [Methanosarcina sp.]|nr:hypothetical protein [Methanosarcina sp.]